MSGEPDLSQSEALSYQDQALAALADMGTGEELAEWHRQHLGRSGELRRRYKLLSTLDASLRPRWGQLLNTISETLARAHAERAESFTEADRKAAAQRSQTDVTLPPRGRRAGQLHPVTAMLYEIISVFERMGFSVYESPHVELDEFNFGLLNMPPHHPARDMQDTFYVSPEVLLRTHTSAGQVRAMRAVAPEPLRVILPGLCYRHEDVTPRSEMQFFQVEGLMVGPHVRLSDLKGLLLAYARYVFGEDQEVRMRASYFPFTEPSVEVDIRCTICRGEGCRVCKSSGWLELLGGGLVHPVVLRNGGYDPEKVSGIAWGMGIERQLLLRHEINDIRLFYRNDLRFLHQFS